MSDGAVEKREVSPRAVLRPRLRLRGFAALASPRPRPDVAGRGRDARALGRRVADSCDAGIRIGESLAQHMVAVPITPKLEMAVVATPAYFACHGTPKTTADLLEHNCVGYRRTGSGAPPKRLRFSRLSSLDGDDFGDR